MWDNRVNAIVLAPRGSQPMLEKGVSAAGLRLLKSLTLDEADSANLDAPSGIMLLDLSEDDARHDPLIMCLDTASRQGLLSLVVRTSLGALDTVSRKIHSVESLIICDPSEEELISSLRSAGAARRHGGTFCDSRCRKASNTPDASALRSTVGRIADRMVRPSEAGDTAPAIANPAIADKEENLPALDATALATEIHGVLHSRRLREEFFGDKLFADPAWDMLLELLEARLRSNQISIKVLCYGAGVPTTTALRWIHAMTLRGLFVRRQDPHDGRRSYIDLSDDAYEGLLRWFARTQQYASRAGI